MSETHHNQREACPLCMTSTSITDVRGADKRRYYLCGTCWLIYADPSHHLSPEAEKARYETHNNNIEDEGYTQFLNRVIQPMLPYLHEDMRGLDYGSGPGPALSQLVQRQGIACEDYDPFFADRPLQPPYDFIFSTECFEHFKNPQAEIQRICDLLKPGGLLGIMTERWTTLEAFANWYYTQDPTHISFYHTNTFEFLCRHFGLKILWQDDSRAVIFQRGHAADHADVASLFDEQPARWGLRGDPHLWREMHAHFDDVPLPSSPDDLVALIQQAFETLTGHLIDEPHSFYIERFSTGGMSSGYISAEFWRGEIIPLLCERNARRVVK